MRGVEKRKRLEWLDGRFGVTVRSTCTTRLALMPGWLQVEKDWVRFAVHVVSFLLADGTFFFLFRPIFLFPCFPFALPYWDRTLPLRGLCMMLFGQTKGYGVSRGFLLMISRRGTKSQTCRKYGIFKDSHRSWLSDAVYSKRTKTPHDR